MLSECLMGDKIYDTLIPEITEPDARKAVYEALLAMFDRWQLNAVNRVLLLGLKDTEAFLWEKQLPDDPEILERVGHLFAIDRALLKLHPYSEDYRNHWINRPEPAFGGIPPLQIMLANGSEGIIEVRELVESQLADLQQT